MKITDLRLTRREIAKRSRLQNKVYGQVRKAIRTGVLPSWRNLKCVDCQRMAQGYEHRDYTHPLKVEPICHSCNIKRGPAIWEKAA